MRQEQVRQEGKAKEVRVMGADCEWVEEFFVWCERAVEQTGRCLFVAFPNNAPSGVAKTVQIKRRILTEPKMANDTWT